METKTAKAGRGKICLPVTIAIKSSASETCDDICYEAEVSLNDEEVGIIRCAKNGWKMYRMEQGLVDAIGNKIF